MKKKFLIFLIAQSLLIYTSSEKQISVEASSGGSTKPAIGTGSGSQLEPKKETEPIGSGSSGGSTKPAIGTGSGSQLEPKKETKPIGGGSSDVPQKPVKLPSSGGSTGNKPTSIDDEDDEDDNGSDNTVKDCSPKILTKRVLDIGLQTSDLVALQKNSQYTNFIQTLTVKEYLELSECFSNPATGDFPQSITLKAYPAMSMFPKIASTVIFTYDDKEEQEAKSCSYKCPCVGKSPTGPVFAAYTSYSDRVGGTQTKFVCATTSQIEQSNQETVTDASAGGTAGGVVGGVVGAGILAGLIGKLLQKELENYKQNRFGWAKFWRAISFGKVPKIEEVDILGIINSEKALKSLRPHEKALLVKAVSDFLTGFYKDANKADTMPSRSAAHIVVYEMAQAYEKINSAKSDTERTEAVKEFEKSIVMLAKDYFDRDKKSKSDPRIFETKVLKFLGDIQPYIFKNADGVTGIKILDQSVQSILKNSYKDDKYDFKDLDKGQMELLFDNFENLPRAAQQSLAYQQATRPAVPVQTGVFGGKTPQPQSGVNYQADLTGKTYSLKGGQRLNHEDVFKPTSANKHYIANDPNSFDRNYGGTSALDEYARDIGVHF